MDNGNGRMARMIQTEADYDAKVLQAMDLLGDLDEYETRVHPVPAPSRWGYIRFHWDRAWRWEIQWALCGALIGVLLTLAWCAP